MTTKTTKTELHTLLASDRARRYPAAYAGHRDDALRYVQREYPTRADALLGCEVFGLVPRGTL